MSKKIIKNRKIPKETKFNHKKHTKTKQTKRTVSYLSHNRSLSTPWAGVKEQEEDRNKTPSPIQVSETTLMKYCGGSGSNTGTKNFTVCSSWANLLQMDKYNLHSITTTKASHKKQKEKKGVQTHHRTKEKTEWEINKKQTHGSWLALEIHHTKTTKTQVTYGYSYMVCV